MERDTAPFMSESHSSCILVFFWQHLTFQLLGNFVVLKAIQLKGPAPNVLKASPGLSRLEGISLDLTEDTGQDDVMTYTEDMHTW